MPAAVSTALAQVGSISVLVVLLVVLLAVLGVGAAVVWGVITLLASLFSGGDNATTAEKWRALADHRAVESTGRYGEASPEVETTVDGRRVVARLETAPGGTDQFAVLQTPMLSVKAGTGFELAEDTDGVALVDSGPDTPSLPDETRSILDGLDEFGGLTVDDRTGLVEHRFPDPSAILDPDTLRRQAEALVAVAEVVETHVEAAARSGDHDQAARSGRVSSAHEGDSESETANGADGGLAGGETDPGPGAAGAATDLERESDETPEVETETETETATGPSE